MGRTARKRRRKARRNRAPAAASGAGATDGSPEASSGGGGEAAASRAEPKPRSRSSKPPRRPGKPELPDPPWGSFPLSELVTLAALIFIVAGFFVEPPRGAVMLGVGLALGSLAGLEISIREHLAGYRSHTLLIAGAAGVAVMAGLFALDPGGLHPGIKAGAGVAVFAVAAVLLARSFRKRSGELFKVRA